jgi:hypothetical protein
MQLMGVDTEHKQRFNINRMVQYQQVLKLGRVRQNAILLDMGCGCK